MTIIGNIITYSPDPEATTLTGIKTHLNAAITTLADIHDRPEASDIAKHLDLAVSYTNRLLGETETQQPVTPAERANIAEASFHQAVTDLTASVSLMATTLAAAKKYRTLHDLLSEYTAALAPIYRGVGHHMNNAATTLGAHKGGNQ